MDPTLVGGDPLAVKVMASLEEVPNPFRQTVVTDPWHPAEIDVPGIHASAFEVCRKALESVRSEGRSTSVLLHGEAGSGKTHLLGRLRAHWTRPDPWGEVPNVVFVAVRLQTGPRRLWRYLRRSVAEDLLRPGIDGGSQLTQILLRRLAEVRPAEGDLALWWEWLRAEYSDPDHLERVVAELFDRLDREGFLGRDLCTVLGHLILGRRLRDARAWLLGDPLPESALHALDVGPAADDDDAQEDQARQVVVALCNLAGPKVPVVLCFDQVEALQVHPNDDAGLFAFGQMAMALYQQTTNALLISCVQSSFLEKLRATVRGAAWARLAVHQSTLDPLRWEEAVRLAVSRMDAEPELARLRSGHRDSLWPLDEAALRVEVGPTGTTARRVLSTCAELFEAARLMTPVPPFPLEPFLETTWRERLDRAARENTPEQADQVLSHGLPLLATCLGREWSPALEGDSRDLDLLLLDPRGRVGVSLCNASNLNSLAARLRRLSEALDPAKLAGLVLVRDARLPISAQAKKTRQHLKDLEARGARLIHPSADAMAALEALRGLLSDAKAGDLAHLGQPVDPRTVQEWLTAHLPDELRTLFNELVDQPTTAGEAGPIGRVSAGSTGYPDREDRLPLEEAATQQGRAIAGPEDDEACHTDKLGIRARARMVSPEERDRVIHAG